MKKPVIHKQIPGFGSYAHDYTACDRLVSRERAAVRWADVTCKQCLRTRKKKR